jgi:hypothetical protein
MVNEVNKTRDSFAKVESKPEVFDHVFEQLMDHRKRGCFEGQVNSE